MADWLCKIWTPLADLLGAVVDVAVQVLSEMSDFAIAAFEDLVGALDGTFGSSGGVGSWLLLAGGALCLWWFLSSDKEEKEPSSAPSSDRQPLAQETVK